MTSKECSVEGCGIRARTRGLCNRHYLRMWRHGDPTAGGASIIHRGVKRCSVEGCDRPHASGGFCGPHYTRWRKHGDPRADIPIACSYKSPKDALRARTVLRDSGCIEWTGAKSEHGYGRLQVDGSLRNAHRVAWELELGPIPPGKVLDHICHNPACVNVKHLRLATNEQNGANRSGPASTSSTGVRNVHKGRRPGMFDVYVGKNGKYHYGGSFSDLDEAADRAAQFRLELYGTFAGRG